MSTGSETYGDADGLTEAGGMEERARSLGAPTPPEEDGQPVLRCFPKEDDLFAAVCERVLLEACRLKLPPRLMLEHILKSVRHQYPSARIQPRHPMAAPPDDRLRVWYCYRDGTIVG